MIMPHVWLWDGCVALPTMLKMYHCFLPKWVLQQCGLPCMVRLRNHGPTQGMVLQASRDCMLCMVRLRGNCPVQKDLLKTDGRCVFRHLCWWWSTALQVKRHQWSDGTRVLPVVLIKIVLITLWQKKRVKRHN